MRRPRSRSRELREPASDRTAQGVLTSVIGRRSTPPAGAGSAAAGSACPGRPVPMRPVAMRAVRALRAAIALASCARDRARAPSRYLARMPAAVACPRDHEMTAWPAILPRHPPAHTSSNGENRRQRSSRCRMLPAISCPAIAEVFSPCRPKPLATQTPRRNSPSCGMPCTVWPNTPPNTSAISTGASFG